MAMVRSAWATSPIVLNGVLSSAEWSGAGVMAIPAGFMMVKNDNHFLYVALDMVGDRGADPGVGDYFWFSVDTNSNYAITPNVDVNYGIYPYLPIRIGRQYYLGPGVWTGILNTPSPAMVRNGFGPSPHSRIPHRIWEMRLPLDEIGIADLGSHPHPAIRFGLRVSSTSPRFTFDFPGNFYRNFSNLHSILLSRTPGLPPAVAGPVIGSVGLIPAKAPQLNGGYATTAPSYYLYADEAAFGGVLNIIGNRTTLQNLWNAGARKYRIMHRAGSAGPFAPLLQSWKNYRWNGTEYSLESFAWDADNKYAMTNPADDYSIDDLLIQWHTVGYAGIHELQAHFYRANGTEIATPPQTVQLMIDNNLPLVDIVQVLHNNVPLSACAIETMTSNSDGVRVKITVNDLEGDLRELRLVAHWGNGASALVHSDAYPAHRNAAHKWNGVNALVVPPGEWVPPVTCAYQFRLSAWPRVTNGYSYIGYVEDTYHVTLLKPVGGAVPVVKRLLETRLPLGQTAEGEPPEEGKEPKKLGDKTFGKK